MIGVDFATYTALSTTTQVTLNGGQSMIVPTNARQIKAIRPLIVPITPTADESVVAKVILDSDDLPLKPAEFALNPIQALLGATGSLFLPQQPVYPINMKCNGGERIQIKGQALKTNTVEPIMGCEIYYDTDAPVLPQLHGKVGTLTASGTAAVEVADSTPMTVNGGTILEMGYGIFGMRQQVASKPYAGRGKIVSNDLAPPFPSTFGISPVGPILSTLGCPAGAPINFADIQLALKQNATLTVSHILDRALTTQGDFAIGVIYS